MDTVVLTIAGSDTWGGGGITTDIKTIEQAGSFAVNVITCIAVESSDSSFEIVSLPASLIKQQLQTIANTYQLSAIKIGLLNDAITIAIVKEFIETQNCPIVIDPVMAFKESSKEIKQIRLEMIDLMKSATVITPNLTEAKIIAESGDIENQLMLADEAKNIYSIVKTPVLVTGGARFPGEKAVDVLFDGEKVHFFELPKLDTLNIHGAGCALSSMIAAQLANNETLEQAIENAKHFVYQGINQGLSLPSGDGGNIWNRIGDKNEK